MSIRSYIQGLNLAAIQQTVKWTVYCILIINFFFYLLDDIEAAEHALRNGGTLLQWAAEFTTTIDELGWFALLFLFELETYSLSDEAFEGITGKLIHGVRLVCYVFLAHTVYAYSGDVLTLGAEEVIAGVTSLCQFVDKDISYTYNLTYTVIDQSNCSTLSTDTVFYHVDSDSLVTDQAGIVNSLQLAWSDLIEAVVWLVIVLLIELIVRLQGHGITGGSVITAANYSKLLLYGILVIIALYWATLEHWLYVWDEFIWIAGFAAIEVNVVEWRDELKEEAGQERNPAA